MARAAALLALTLALAAPFFDAPMQRDQGVYAACGSSLLHGDAPYRDCWDTKAPLTHYTYALAQALFGVNLAGPVIVSALMAALTGLLLWRIARRWFGDGIAWAAGLAYAWLVVSIPFDMNAQPEGFANLFIAGGVWGLLNGLERKSRWRLFGAGVAFAIAVAYKYTIALPVGVIAITAIVTAQQLTNVKRQTSNVTFYVSLGFLATFALFILYLLARGALPYAFEHVVFMLTEFPKVAVNPTLLLFPGESGPPLFYLQRTMQQLARLPVFYALATPGCALAVIKRRQWGWLITLWLVATLASVYPQKVMTLYHWTLALAPLMLGAGALVWELGQFQTLRVSKTLRVLAALLLIGNLGVRVYEDQWLILGKYLTGQQTRAELYASQAIQDEIEVAEYIRSRTTPDEPLWVWGNHSLMYYWADRRSPTRFIFNSPLMAAIGPNDFQPRWKQEVLEALYAHPPTYIVITYYDRTWFDYENPVEQFQKIPGYQSFLDRYYRQETFLGRFAIHRLTPWWSRLNPPELLDAVTAVDLLGALESAELAPPPNQPIEVREFKLYDEASYPALLMHPEAQAAFNVALPAGVVCFRADLALDPASWGWGGDGAAFAVAVDGKKIFERYVGNTANDRFWQPILVDLSPWAGQFVRLTLSTGPGPGSDFTGDMAGWGLPRIVRSPGNSCASQVVIR